MKILIKSVEPGTKRLIEADSNKLVGYLRRDGEKRWIVVDHISGHDVDYTQGGFRNAVYKARTYFGHRVFCFGGCGRFALSPRVACPSCLIAAA